MRNAPAHARMEENLPDLYVKIASCNSDSEYALLSRPAASITDNTRCEGKEVGEHG